MPWSAMLLLDATYQTSMALPAYYPIIVLTNEEQFTIFGQRPHLVIHHKLKLIDMVAYDIHARYNRVVICYCLFALIVDAVGSLAGVDHLLGFLHDCCHVGRHALDSVEVELCEFVTLFIGEQSL